MICWVGIECVFMGLYWDEKVKGIYKCICCGMFLFSLEIKYDFGFGWLSYYEFIINDVV